MRKHKINQKILRNTMISHKLNFILFFKRFYLFYFLERERNINVWLLLAHSSLGTWPATQACALDWESNRRPLDSQASTLPLSHTSQGHKLNFNKNIYQV